MDPALVAQALQSAYGDVNSYTTVCCVAWLTDQLAAGPVDMRSRKRQRAEGDIESGETQCELFNKVSGDPFPSEEFPEKTNRARRAFYFTNISRLMHMDGTRYHHAPCVQAAVRAKFPDTSYVGYKAGSF